MIAEEWARVKEIVGEALDRPAERRASYLEAACSQDTQLRAEVDSLLAAYEEASGLSRSFWAPDLDAVEQPPESIGPYKLVRELGVGGMGWVWLAEQTEPVHRWVALKLIRAGMFDADVAQRFRSERQSLAQMDHPAIAKVFDAGATATGQPYLVMEFVDGLPINEYCDQRRLSIPERLRLFLLVCEGVQHAHRKAVIHRDLKPSNILVVDVDEKPMPRIIDFGLAKAMVKPAHGEVLLTKIGTFLGTPGYMSPEQADPSLHDVDTRADVFSLGVILYELLTGTLPFRNSSTKQMGIEEVLRKLRETDVERPSSRVSREVNDKSTQRSVNAENRHAEVRQLAKVIRGDLDAIALKALERDREQRYNSPSELAADINSYLENRPIQARPASAPYRWGKYLRRHRVAALIATAASVLLVAFVINQAIQLKRIKQERDRADRIAQFTSSIFTVSDPSEARGNKITARELLDRAEQNVDSELKDDPLLRAQMLEVIGGVYQKLGLYSRGNPTLQKAVQIDERVLGVEDPKTLAIETDYIHGLAMAGRLKEADAAARRLLTIATRVLGEHHKTTLEAKADLAWALDSESQLKEAEQLGREALAGQLATLGEEHHDTIETMRTLAWTLATEDKFSEAESIERKALEASKRTKGPENQETLLLASDLATIYGWESRNSDAEQLLRETLAIQRRILGPDHQNTATTANSLAIILQHEKKFPEAETLYRECAESNARTMGPENRGTLLARMNLATVWENTGRVLEAEEEYKKVLEIQKRVLGLEHQDTYRTLFNLADLNYKRKRYGESLAYYRQAAEVSRKVFGIGHPETMETVYNLACVLNLNGKPDASLATLRELVDAGYSNIKELEADNDLKSLSADPRFGVIVTRVRSNAQAASQKTTR